MFSLFISLSLCLDLQARCSAGDSVGHLWSDDMATNCGDVFLLRPRTKERPKGPPPHVVCYPTTASSRTCRGWSFPRLVCLTAEPFSLGTKPMPDVTLCMRRSNR